MFFFFFTEKILLINFGLFICRPSILVRKKTAMSEKKLTTEFALLKHVFKLLKYLHSD